MSHIQHLPWIGESFAISPQKIMILGESHHGGNPGMVNMTVPVVEEWLAGASNPSYRFFTHLAVALSGQEPSNIDRASVFRDIAFYNYIKTVMPCARFAPTPDEFANSKLAFREVVEQLCPSHIVVCGLRLWSEMRRVDPPEQSQIPFSLNAEIFHLAQYKFPSARPLVLCIKHPQSGFNGRKWYPKIQAFKSIKADVLISPDSGHDIK